MPLPSPVGKPVQLKVLPGGDTNPSSKSLNHKLRCESSRAHWENQSLSGLLTGRAMGWLWAGARVTKQPHWKVCTQQG